MGTIQKRGDTYRVLIRKAGLPPISKTFPKKAIAQRWMIDTEAKIASGDYKHDDALFGDLVRKYLVEIGKIKPFGRSKRALLHTLERNLGDVKLTDLTTQRLTNYAVNRAVAPSTVMQDMIYIGVVLQTAESMWGAQPRMDEYKKAMTALKKLGVIAESRERDRRVSDEEVQRILAHCTSSLPMSDLVWFSIHTAMRNGEVFRIRWDDLRHEGRAVIIRERKHPTHKRDQEVPMVQEAVEIVSRQPRVSDRIFPYNGKSVSTAFQRARDDAGLHDIRWHDLRHEGVSRLFERGLDMMTVAVFSGHRDINMLRRYTHLNARQILDSL